jgi:hypothetical protein
MACGQVAHYMMVSGTGNNEQMETVVKREYYCEECSCNNNNNDNYFCLNMISDAELYS